MSEIAERERVQNELRVAEQTVQQASKLAALGEMSAGVSHELNQPLAAMKTYLAGARLLLNRRRPEEALSSFQRIDDLIDRMGAITRQLKSYAHKGDRLQLEPVDLRACVREALALMAPQLAKTPVAITTSMPAEPVMVRADPIRTEQIVVNLLRNAIEASPPGGLIRASIEGTPGRVWLRVTDQGAGVPERHVSELFEPFFTLKPEGTGLGLFLSRSLVEAHWGTLSYQRENGHTTFTIDLPTDPR